MRREIHEQVVACCNREFLLDFRRMTMACNRIGGHAFARFAKQSILLKPAAGARYTGLGINNEVVIVHDIRRNDGQQECERV